MVGISMRKLLPFSALCGAFFMPAVAMAAGPIYGPLQAQNALSELSANPAAALHNLGITPDSTLRLSGGTMGLPSVNASGAGAYNNITVDAQGRITAVRGFNSGDITGALGFTPINRAANGSDFASPSATLTNLGGVPTSAIGTTVAPLSGGVVPPSNLPAATTNTQGAMSLTTAATQAPVQSVAGLTGAPGASAVLSAIKPTTTITAGTTYLASTTDVNICINLNTPAPFSVTLPVSPTANKSYDITDCAQVAAADPITVTPASGTVMGQSSLLMNLNGENITLKYVAGDWKIQ